MKLRQKIQGNLLSTETGANLRHILDAIPVMLWSASPQGSIDFMNEQWLRYSGESREMDLVAGLPGVIHCNDILRVKNAWISAVAVGGTFETDLRRKGIDGEYRWFHECASPLRDENNTILRWYGVSVNIDEQKRVEASLGQVERHLKEMQLLLHAGSWGWDARTNDNYEWSREAYGIFGLDPNVDSCSCQAICERISPQDLPRVRQRFEQAVKARADFEANYRIVLPNGTTKQIHSIGRPILDPSGCLIEFSGMVVDVTGFRMDQGPGAEAFQDTELLKVRPYKEDLKPHDEMDHIGLFDRIVGSSDSMRRSLIQVRKVAPTESSVLVTGETGTGKECVCRAIHKLSARSAGAFLPLNCRAITASQLERVLFEPSAHNSSNIDNGARPPETANKGTILLDDIAELSTDAQVILLRFLQDRENEVSLEARPADWRILAVSSQNLAAAVAAGTFRRDLFYRLNVFPIELPPLRERKGDIRQLALYLTEFCSTKLGKQIKTIDNATLHLLESYEWPGNVRELRNVIERSVVLCENETLSIDASWLRTDYSRGDSSAARSVVSLEETERRTIEAILVQTRGRVAGTQGAAAKLGIPRSTLESKIKSLGINKHLFKK
jgi:formate hydrogenlyase transcriptional activator